MPRSFPASCLLISSLISAPSDLGAQSSATEKLKARLKSAEQYGIECCQMLSIPASAFHPIDLPSPVPPSSIVYESLGYVRVNPVAWAPVHLPTGAVLDFIDYYYFDDDPNQDSCAGLQAFSGPTLFGSPPSEETVGQVCTSGADGYGYAIEEIAGTIDNSVWFSGGAQYTVVVGASSPVPGVFPDSVFKGVTIWWHREVSPPPGTATFNDVPTDHPQFQFIEALAESGITVGCGGGNYCADSPLTRGQMAVFLSKALGLYWPF